MKMYKGFDKDLKCRDFKYEVGKTYEEDKAELCRCGFHACENPMEIFAYYNPADSRYCEVDLDATDETQEGNSKRCGKKIHVEAEIGLNGIVEAGVKFILGKVDFKNAKKSNTGDYSAATNTDCQSAATNTGYRSVATNTGYQSAATNTGDYSAATNIGDCSVATNTGDYSVATDTGNHSVATNTGCQSAATNTGYRSVTTNTGYRSAATNTGDCSAATNTGDCSAATNIGDCSVATNTGCQSAATVEGKESVAISLGIEGKAKGSVGCWIIISEWTKNDCEYRRKEVKAFYVDGENVKADTFYTLVDGKAVECNKK